MVVVKEKEVMNLDALAGTLGNQELSFFGKLQHGCISCSISCSIDYLHDSRKVLSALGIYYTNLDLFPARLQTI